MTAGKAATAWAWSGGRRGERPAGPAGGGHAPRPEAPSRCGWGGVRRGGERCRSSPATAAACPPPPAHRPTARSFFSFLATTPISLAPLLVRKIFETVKAINQGGVTVLLVEQNVRQALALAHRACVLENGRLVLAGPARDLLSDDRLKRAYLGM